MALFRDVQLMRDVQPVMDYASRICHASPSLARLAQRVNTFSGKPSPPGIRFGRLCARADLADFLFQQVASPTDLRQAPAISN